MFDFDEVEAQFSKSADDPAARTLPELPESPWIGMYRRNASARIRLYAVLGVGVPASSYTSWVGQEVCQKYPAIEVVILELPGHGDNPPPALFDPFTAATEVAKAIGRLQFKDQQVGDRKRPFALYGFSMGALLLWDVARQLEGIAGERCKKLYVAARGGPHLYSRSFAPPEVPIPRAKPDAKVLGGIENVHNWCIERVTYTVDPAQVEKYKRWFAVLRKTDEQKIIDFAETLRSDEQISGPGIQDDADKNYPLKLECPIQFFYSDIDEVWESPARGNEDLNPHPMSRYDDLCESWERYAPSKEQFTATLLEGQSHGQLGTSSTPAFEIMMEDLTRMIATEVL